MAARVPYVDREHVAPEYRHIYDSLIAERGLPVRNLFRALANTPPIMEKHLALSSQLRFKTKLDGQLRELAILAVGAVTGAEYEYTAHWHIGTRLGIPREKLEQVLNYETAPGFSDAERAVLRYACEVTRNVKVSDATVEAVRRHLPLWEFMELAHIVAFYNMVVRLLEPLGVELDPDTTPVKR